MKSRFQRSSGFAIFRSRIPRILALSLGVSLAFAGTQRSAFATPELDRRFSLDNIGFLRAWDNVDGLFGDYVASAYREYFAKQSRFTLQDISKANTVLTHSKISYGKLIEDPQILRQIARSMHLQSLIRTRIYKEGPVYRFVLEWIHPNQMDMLSTETFTIEESRDGKGFEIDAMKRNLVGALDRMIKKVPFYGQVTGRDERSVTVNLGSLSGLQKGDTLVIGTLEEVKKHPLLKTDVDWRFSQTGHLAVETVDEGIAFCRVIGEEPGKHVNRDQKIIQIIAPPQPEAPKMQVMNSADEHRAEIQKQPRLGWGAAGLWVGNYSREYNSVGGSQSQGRSGSGLFSGVRAEGQVWFNRNWFGELGLGYGHSGFSQTDLATGADVSGYSFSSDLFRTRIDLGYTYFPTVSFFGPKAWLKLGYNTTSYNTPFNRAESVGPASFKGPFIGVGGDLPIRGRYGALLTLDFGFLNSGDAKPLNSEKTAGVTSVQFFLGGYYRFDPRMNFRVGIDALSQGITYPSGATLSNNVISLGPSLQVYF